MSVKLQQYLYFYEENELLKVFQSLKFQISMANNICVKLSGESEKICNELENGYIYFIIINKVLGRSLISRNFESQIGKIMIEAGGYCLESPIEKNW